MDQSLLKTAATQFEDKFVLDQTERVSSSWAGELSLTWPTSLKTELSVHKSVTFIWQRTKDNVDLSLNSEF